MLAPPRRRSCKLPRYCHRSAALFFIVLSVSGEHEFGNRPSRNRVYAGFGHSIKRSKSATADFDWTAGSKSAGADFDILKCQSRASPTLVPPALLGQDGRRPLQKSGRDARGPVMSSLDAPGAIGIIACRTPPHPRTELSHAMADPA